MSLRLPGTVWWGAFADSRFWCLPRPGGCLGSADHVVLSVGGRLLACTLSSWARGLGSGRGQWCSVTLFLPIDLVWSACVFD